jgi:hypothetical protein
MRKAVVDRQSATIKIVDNGVVTRELPYRVLVDGTVTVVDGNKLRVSSGLLLDLRKWHEDGRQSKFEMNGWNMRPSDRSTFAGVLPAKSLAFPTLGPRQRFIREEERLLRRLSQVVSDEKKIYEIRLALALEVRDKARALGVYAARAEGEEREILEELRLLLAREETRRKDARHQSRRKRPTKAERAPKKKFTSEKSDAGEKKSKKKGKKKKGADANEAKDKKPAAKKRGGENKKK